MRYDQNKKAIVDARGMPLSIDAIRNLTDQELSTAIANSNHTYGGPDLLEELGRRDAAKQTATIVDLTRQIRTWTIIVVIATVISLMLVAFDVLRPR